MHAPPEIAPSHVSWTLLPANANESTPMFLGSQMLGKTLLPVQQPMLMAVHEVRIRLARDMCLAQLRSIPIETAAALRSRSETDYASGMLWLQDSSILPGI